MNDAPWLQQLEAYAHHGLRPDEEGARERAEAEEDRKVAEAEKALEIPAWSPPSSNERPEHRVDGWYDQDVQEVLRQREIQRKATRIEVARKFSEPPEYGSLADELANPPEEPAYTITDLHVYGGNTLLGAKKKAGKTTLLVNLVRSLTEGSAFLDFFPVRRLSGNVAFWNYEVSRGQFLRWMAAHDLREPGRTFLWHLRGYRLPLENDYVAELAVGWLREREIEVLITDPFARAYTGSEESSNSEVGAWLERLDEVKKEAGITDAFLAHHFGHQGERSRGASRLEDWPDSIWTLTRKGHERYFSAEGRDVFSPEGRLDFDQATKRLTLAGGSRKEEQMEDDVIQVLRTVKQNPGLTYGDLEEEVEGMSKERRGSAIKEARGRGLIDPGSESSHSYTITAAGEKKLP